MGAMCFKSRKFDGEAHRLNSTTNDLNPGTINKPTRHENDTAQDKRKAAAQAAELRAKEAANRGTNKSNNNYNSSNGISKALAQQPTDGGRFQEAISTGSQSNSKPIVWD